MGARALGNGFKGRRNIFSLGGQWSNQVWMGQLDLLSHVGDVGSGTRDWVNVSSWTERLL